MLFVLALAVAVVAAVRGVWSPCGMSMLSSLNPISEAGRGHRFWVTASWYVAGALTGGALLGTGMAAVAAGLGRVALPDSLVWSLVLATAVVAVASDTRVVGRSLPVHPRQVDERWLVTYRRWIYAGGYGVQIGAGFATYIMTAAVYLTAALGILTASAGQAFVVALVFGGVRGLAIVACGLVRSPGALRALLATVDGWAVPSTWVAAATSGGVAVTAGGVLGGPAAAGLVAAALVAAVALSRRRAGGWGNGLVGCAVPSVPTPGLTAPG